MLGRMYASPLQADKELEDVSVHRHWDPSSLGHGRIHRAIVAM